MQNPFPFDSIIFDIDGTLWDSTDCSARAYTKVLMEEEDLKITVTGADLRRHFGKPMDEIAQAVMPGLSRDRRDSLMARIDHYQKLFLRDCTPDLYPGTRETLAALCARYPLFLVSNCQAGYIEQFLEVTGLTAYFQDHLCPGDTDRLKAENIRSIIERNGLKNPVYIGDTPGDHRACREADVPFIWASYGFGQVSAPYDRIDAMPELLTVLDKESESSAKEQTSADDPASSSREEQVKSDERAGKAGTDPADPRPRQTRRESLHDQGFRTRWQYTQISLYVIATVIVIYLLTQVTDHLPTVLSVTSRGLGYARAVLTPLIGGLALSYLLHPAVNFFQKKLDSLPFLKKKAGSQRPLAVILTWLSLVMALVVILSSILSSVTHEITLVNLESLTDFVESTGRSLKSLYANMQDYLTRFHVNSAELDNAVQRIGQWFSSLALHAGNNVLGTLSNLAGFLANLLFSIILSIYLLLDSHNLTRYWDRVLKALTGRRFYQGTHTALRDADEVFSGYIRGQLMDALIMFLMVSVALSLLRIKFAIIIGVLTGIGNLIPYIGPFVAYAATALVCAVNGDWKKLLISIVVLFLVQTLDGNVINPHLLSQNISVHPILVIVALTVGSAVGGLVGMLLAVPIAALLQKWFDRFVEYTVRRKNSDDDPDNDV